MTELMPTIFFGHGNPMNAISKNAYTDSWASIGKSIPRPRAVLAISAHWYIPGCAVTVNTNPRTIHDFGGFPKKLFEVQYPAPGCLELARRVNQLLSTVSVALEENWGIDHGTWSVLTHVFPNADVPVVQLSIDERQSPIFHYELGKQLGALREEGILVIGSGNLVHNLRTYTWGNDETPPFDWAVRFETMVRELILQRNDDKVVAYESFGSDATLSVPTPDHYLPLLYVLGLRREHEQISFPVEGFDGGSISMLTVRIG